MTVASAQMVPSGLANAQIALARKAIPVRMCARRQCRRTTAGRNSFGIAPRKITPRRTPTAAADVVVNRNTITETISHAIPVSSDSHHGPASRHRRARSRDLLSTRNCLSY